MKNLLIITAFLSSFGIAAFAADTPKTEETLVILAPANTCYKARISPNQLVLRGLSGQIPCGENPGKILPVNSWKKHEDGKCLYSVGQAFTYAGGRGQNNIYKFDLVARCPTDQK